MPSASASGSLDRRADSRVGAGQSWSSRVVRLPALRLLPLLCWGLCGELLHSSQLVRYTANTFMREAEDEDCRHSQWK